MSTAVEALLRTLDLEQLDTNLFRALGPHDGWQRVFGGQVIGQALSAACRTVENRLPHSLHGYFMLAGDQTLPIIYEVDRIRDGRSFTTRRVIARQRGAAIFALECSFQVTEDGLDHQVLMPKVALPEDIPQDDAILPLLPEAVRRYYTRKHAIQLRPVDFDRYLPGTHEPVFNMWIRAAEHLPDDPVLHRCVLAYASDLTLLDTASVAHNRSIFGGDIQAASLDHALWFHRPFRADEWLLYAQDSPSSSGARGFSRGQIFRRDGVLIASVAQEGLMRVRRQGP